MLIDIFLDYIFEKIIAVSEVMILNLAIQVGNEVL